MGRYARGEAAAFELLYRRHELRVWRYLQRNLKNAATADEFDARGVVRRSALMPRATCLRRVSTTWLFSIAHNRDDRLHPDAPPAYEY